MEKIKIVSYDGLKSEANIIIKNKINYIPKISIILPVYNVERYLKECLDSVLNQSFKEFEIICVDDASTDNSLNILKDYACKDNRITIATQKKYGAAVARNVGLKLAKGEYLLIIDSDDMLEVDSLDKLYKKTKNNDLDICIFNCYYYNNQTKQKEIKPWTIDISQIPNKEVFSWEEYAKVMYTCSPNWAWNKLFKKSFIDKHNIVFQETRHTNDTLFTCFALSMAERISILNERLLLYRVNQKSSLTSKGYRNRYPFEILKVLLRIKEELVKNNRYELLQYTYRNLVLGQLIFNLSKTTGFSNFMLYFSIKLFFAKKLDILNLKDEDIIFPHLKDGYALICKRKIFKEILKFIFSLKNDSRKTHKIITVLGFKLKIKRRVK